MSRGHGQGVVLAAVVTLGAAAARGLDCESVTVTYNINQTSTNGVASFAGRVGIGTANPSNLLHIVLGQSASPAFLVLNYPQKGATYLLEGAYGDCWLLSHTNGMHFLALGSGAPSWFANYPLAVGKQTAQGRFDVQSAGTNTTPLRVWSSGGQRLFDLAKNAQGAGEVVVGNPSGQERVRLRAGNGASYVLGSNVGVGTTTPAATLHVAGAGRLAQGAAYVPALGDVGTGIYGN